MKKIGKILLRILKFIFKEIVSFFIKLTLGLTLILFVVLIILYSGKEVETPNDSYLVLDLSKEYQENKVESFLDRFDDKKMTFYEMINKLDRSKTDTSIKGIVVLTDNNKLTRTQIEELKKELDILKKSKMIISYGTQMDNDRLLLTSSVTKSIMSPTASTQVNITGYNRELGYYKGLADKLGIKVEVIHVGDFKSYGENYTKNEMSPELKGELTRVYTESYNQFLNGVKKIDRTTLDKMILSGDLMAQDSNYLYSKHLIDELGYLEDIKSKYNIENTVAIQDYSVEDEEVKEKIAIIYADGDIQEGDTSIKDGITSKSLISMLKEAETDNEVKGIVLRVNSPGGSALTSDIINNYIKRMRKPVYISIGSMGASGGYYISCAGKKIFADSSSIVGSIGVVSVIPNLEEMSKKLGINIDGVSYGEYSDLYSLTKQMTPEKREKIYQANLRVYKEFLKKVSDGRKIPIEKVEELAQGKIYLGTEAKNIGLVDNIGGLKDTIKQLGKDLKLSDYEVVELGYKKEISDMFENDILNVKMLLNLKEVDPQNILEEKVLKNKLLFKPIMYLDI